MILLQVSSLTWCERISFRHSSDAGKLSVIDAANATSVCNEMPVGVAEEPGAGDIVHLL